MKKIILKKYFSLLGSNAWGHNYASALNWIDDVTVLQRFLESVNKSEKVLTIADVQIPYIDFQPRHYWYPVLPVVVVLYYDAVSSSSYLVPITVGFSLRVVGIWSRKRLDGFPYDVCVLSNLQTVNRKEIFG